MAQELSVKLSILPELNVQALNALLTVLKQGLGELGKNIQLIDPKVFDKTMKAYQTAVDNTHPVNIPAPKVKPPDTKPFEESGNKSGMGFKERFLSGTQGLQQGLNGMMGTMIGVFGGNLLTGGMSGLVNSFKNIYNAGAEVTKIAEDLRVGFATAGIAANDMQKYIDINAESATRLSQTYAIDDDEITKLTATYLKFGGTTDNLSRKQELIIGLAEKAGISYELAAKSLAKGTDPEIEGQLTRVGIKFDQNATEADRWALINEKVAGTLEGLAAKANTPLGKIEAFKIAFDNIKENVGASLIDAFAPAITMLTTVLIPRFQDVIQGFTSIISFLKPLGPVFLAVGSAAAIMVTAMLGLQGLKFIAGLASSATQFGLAIMQKVIPALVVQDVTTKSMVLNAQALNLGTLRQIATDSLHTAVLGIKTAALWLASGAMTALNATFLASPIGWIVIGIAGLVAGFILLYKHVESFRDAINKAFNFVVGVFSGVLNVIKSIFGGGGTSAGEAFRNGFNASVTESSFKDAKDKLDKAFKSGTEMNVKISANADFEKTVAEYEKLQSRIASLGQKKATGSLTADEQAEFELTTSKVEQLKKKLSEVGPEAKTNIKSVVDANGNLVESYDLNIQKLKEMQSAQAKSLGGDQSSAVKKYSASLDELSNKYNDQKSYLADLKRQVDATNDPDQKTELMNAYNEENAKINKNKKALVDSLVAGMDAGLLTAKSIQNVSQQLGITETQAREMALAKALKKASDEGKLTAESAAEMGKKYGVSYEKVQQNVAELQKAKIEAEKTKKELLGWSDALDASKKAASSARKDIVQAALDLKSGKITQEQYNEVTAKGLKSQKDAVGLQKELNQTTEQLRKQGLLIADEEDKTSVKAEKATSNKKTAYEIGMKVLESERKSLDAKLQSNELENETLILGQGRNKNLFDEMTLHDMKAKKLQDEKDLIEKTYKALGVYNKDGVLIGFKGVKKEDFESAKEKMNSDISKLNNDLTKENNEGIKLQAKINLDPIEISKKQLELKKQNIEFLVKLGLAKESDFIPILKEEVKNAQAFLDSEKAKQKNLEAAIDIVGPPSPAQKKALDEVVQSVQDADNKLLKSQNDLKTEEAKIQEERLKKLDDIQKKKEDILQKELNAQKKFFDAYMKAFEIATTKEVDAQKSKAMKQLDREYGKSPEIDPKEQAYNREKEEIEAKHQRKLLAIQSASQTLQSEQQRQSDIAILKQKQEAESAKLSSMDKTLPGYDKQVQLLDDLNTQLIEKGDLLKTYGGQLQESMGEIFGNLFTGNEEGLKNSWAKIAGSLSSMLKKELAVAVTSQLLQTLSVSGPYAWLASAAIGAVIYAALSAIIDPIIGSLTSFAVGGEVNAPTLAWVGDAQDSGNADNTEWIFNSRLINMFIKRIIDETMDKFLAQLTAGLTSFNLQLGEMLSQNGISYSEADNSLFTLPTTDNQATSYQDSVIQPFIQGLTSFSFNIAQIESNTEQLAELNSSIETLNVSLDYYKDFEPSSILNSQVLTDFLSVSIDHYKKVENQLDLILGAIHEGKVISLNGRVLTEEINRTNKSVNSRIRSTL